MPAATGAQIKVGFDLLTNGFIRDTEAQIRSLEEGADMCEYACARLRELAPHFQAADWHRLLMTARTLALISLAMPEAPQAGQE